MNIESAKKAAEFANIQKTDSRGRVTQALVPGHKGIWYEVIIRRQTKDTIETECTCAKDGTPCKGNSNNICYHSLAAIIAGAKKTKAKVAFCEEEEAAGKLANMGGHSHIVQSSQSKKTVWMVVKDLLKATMVC